AVAAVAHQRHAIVRAAAVVLRQDAGGVVLGGGGDRTIVVDVDRAGAARGDQGLDAGGVGVADVSARRRRRGDRTEVRDAGVAVVVVGADAVGVGLVVVAAVERGARGGGDAAAGAVVD